MEAKGLLKHWKTSLDTIGEDMCPFIAHTLTKKVYDFTEESDSQLVNIEPDRLYSSRISLSLIQDHFS